MLACKGSAQKQMMDGEDDQILFPPYNIIGCFGIVEDASNAPGTRNGGTALPKLRRSSGDISVSPGPHATGADDHSVRHEPQGQVDYLSHEWEEEDLWLSWRYVMSSGLVHKHKERLQNASWRAWMKAKYRLRTVSPDFLEW